MEWRPVNGHPGYHVSDHGIVRGPSGRELKPWSCSPAGYPHLTYYKVALWKQRRRAVVFVHRLVLLTFVGEPPEGLPDAGHKNHDTADNRLVNLEWCSRAENVAASYDDAAVDRRQDRAIADERDGLLDGRPDFWPGVPF